MQADIFIEPTTFRLLLVRQTVDEVTQGGILLPKDVVKSEQEAVNIGKIVALGESCGEYFRRTYDAKWPLAVGDFILYRRHHGLVIEDPVTKKEYVLLNDEHVEAKYLAQLNMRVQLHDRK